MLALALASLAPFGSFARRAFGAPLGGALPQLSVERPADAVGCPDAPAVAAALRELTGREVVTTEAGAGAGERWLVTVRREGAGYEAVVRVEGARSGERRLSAPGVACGELREAIAVTIALVLDHALVLEPPRAKAAPARPEKASWGVSAEGRVGAAIGLLDGVGALVALGVDAGPRPGRLTFGVGAFGVSPSTVAYDQGTIDLSLFGAYLRACRELVGAPRALRGGLCALGLGGALGGKGRGYPGNNRQAYTPWVAPGVSALLRGPLAGDFGWSLAATGYLPLLRNSFSVGNRGLAYETAPVAASLEAGVSWAIR